MIAYRIGPRWKGALLVVIVISLLAYIVRLVLAFKIDQPFGPVLVIVLSRLAVFRYLIQMASDQQRRGRPGWRFPNRMHPCRFVIGFALIT